MLAIISVKRFLWKDVPDWDTITEKVELRDHEALSFYKSQGKEYHLAHTSEVKEQLVGSRYTKYRPYEIFSK